MTSQQIHRTERIIASLKMLTDILPHLFVGHAFMSTESEKLWDGRFSESTDAFVEAFTASVTFDQVLAPFDIEGSIAHATMLHEQSIISEAAFHANS